MARTRYLTVICSSLCGAFALTGCGTQIDKNFFSPGAPTVTSISPSTFGVAGSGTVTVTGTHFRNSTLIKLGDANCAVTAVTPTQIQCTVTGSFGGTVDVKVLDSDTEETDVLVNGFKYQSFLYSASNTSPGQVDGFIIDPDTGSLTATPNSPYAMIGNYGYGVNIHPSNLYVYASSYSGNRITGYSIDHANSGELTYIGDWPGPGNVDAAAITPDGNYLYGVAFGAGGDVQGYSVDQSTGLLTSLGATVDLTGCANISQATVSPNGKLLLMSCYSPGGLGVMSIAADGSLAFVGLWGTGNSDAIGVHSGGEWVYTGIASTAGTLGGSNPAQGGVGFFDLDPDTGTLDSVTYYNHGDNSNNGSGASVHINNGHLVTSARNTGSVQIWTINSSTGALTLANRYDSADGVSADTNDARFDKTGRYMFTSCTAAGTVDFFTFDVDTSSIIFQNTYPTAGGPGVMDTTL